MILLHVHLDQLMPVQRVCRTWIQTIKASPRLSIAISLYPFKGSVKHITLAQASCHAVIDTDELQVKEAAADSPYFSNFRRAQPRLLRLMNG